MTNEQEKARYWHEAVPVIRDVVEEMDKILSQPGELLTAEGLAARIVDWQNRLIVVCL